MNVQKGCRFLQVSVQRQVDCKRLEKIAFVLTVMQLNRIEQCTAPRPAALLFDNSRNICPEPDFIIEQQAAGMVRQQLFDLQHGQCFTVSHRG
ncbi:hypothetical protein D3C80_1455670 [compost metagenome]